MVADLRETLLLLTLLTTSLAYCPGLYSYKTCFLLYTALESALLNQTSTSVQNLYNLREEYFPSSHPPPLYGHVNYTIIIKDATGITKADATGKPIILCDGAQPDTVIKNLNGSKHLFLWSDSGLLAKLEPFILSFYQLEILSYIFGAVGIIDYRFYPYPPKPSYVVLNITLELETMPCTPTKDQLIITLQDLTSWLKVYARAQGKPTPQWDRDDKRYAVDQEEVASGAEYYILFANYIVLSAFVTTALWGLSPRAYKAAATKAATSDSFCFRFWGVVVVTILWNTVTIIFEPVIIVKYLVVSPKWTDISNMALAFGCAKVIQLSVFLVTDFIATVLIVKVFQRDTYFPVPALLKVMADLCCCCRYVRSNTHTVMHKFLQLVAMWNLLFFVHTVTIGVLPTILWVFILPIKMLSVISLTTAALFSLTAFMATMFSLLPLVRPPSPGPILLTSNQAQASRVRDDKNSQNKCSIMIQMLLIPQLFAVVTLMFVLYLNLVTTQMDTNKPTDILASFVPTALLAVVGWVYTKGEWKPFSSNQGQTHSRRDSDSANLHSPQGNPPTDDQTNESGSEDSDDQLLQP